MADVLIDFEEGRQLHTVQQQRLGELATDSIGNTWSYVEFREAVQIGEVVRDAEHADISSAAGTAATAITTASAADTNRLIATGEFNVQSNAERDVRGAIGGIVAGAGEGQNFTVLDRIDNDTIVVQVLTYRDSTATPQVGFVTDGNWQTALVVATTRYRLAFPGAVFLGDGLADNVRGFAQVDVTDDNITDGLAYGWVQQTGLGFVKLDVSEDAPVTGEGLVQAGAGMVKGFTAADTTADEAAAVIAKCVLGNYATPNAADDELIWAELQVNNRAQSYRLPHDRHPFAQPGQRIV